jgi:benzoate membrane transport protein
MSEGGTQDRMRSLAGRAWEPGPGFRQGLADLPRNINLFTVFNGIIAPAIIFITLGAAIISPLQELGTPTNVIVAWVCVTHALGGVIALVMSFYYKMPIMGAWAVPGFILAVPTIQNDGLAVAFGGFWLAGLFVLLLGVTGTLRWLTRWVPLPVLMGMTAGILLPFPIEMVASFKDSALIVAAGIIGYLIFDRLGGPFRQVPGILGTTLLGGAAALAAGQVSVADLEFGWGRVAFTAPSFTLASLLSIAIPLTLIVALAENMQAYGILTAERYNPPLNSFTTISGIGGMLAALIGGHNANIAGPTTAVVASADSGPKEGRYLASSIAGITWILMAVVGGTVVSILEVVPGPFEAVLLGMVLLRPSLDAIEQAWRPGKFLFGALVAFFVALANVTFFSITAPFWALLAGTVASLAFEFDDFRGEGEEEDGEAEETER